MDILTMIGLAAGAFLMVYGITSSGDLISFFDPSSIYITVGGTVAAILMSMPFKVICDVPKYFKIALFPKKFAPQEYIKIIVEMAMEARKNGLLSLEGKVEAIKDPFMKRSILLIVDAIEPERVRTILETDMALLEERHEQGRVFFEKTAGFAPGFGMLGTLIGLINMLKELTSNIDALGPNMSVALITTFYGSLIANLFCLPLAHKLKVRHDEEMICKRIVLDGVLSIQAGENYRHIQEKLMAYLPPKMRKTVDDAETKKA